MPLLGSSVEVDGAAAGVGCGPVAAWDQADLLADERQVPVRVFSARPGLARVAPRRSG